MKNTADIFKETLKELGFADHLPNQMSNSDYWLCTTTAMVNYAKQFTELVKNHEDLHDVSGSFSEFVTWARQADLWEGHEMDSLADNFREFNEDNKR